MIVIFGLVVLLAAVIIGVAGVLGNSGTTHALTDGFAVFGYHVTGSTGTLFLYGIVVGAVGVVGLSLLLAGARRTSRRGRLARRELKQSRLETTAARQEYDRSSAPQPGSAPTPPPGGSSSSSPDRRHPFGDRPGGSTAAPR